MSDKKSKTKTVRSRNLSKPLSESVMDRQVRNYTSLTNKMKRAQGGKVSYKAAFEAMSPKEKAKHNNSLATFTKAAKKFNKENPKYNKKTHGLRKHKDGTRSIL